MKLTAAWLTSSFERLFPLGKPGRGKSLQLVAARGERISFQVGYTVRVEYAADVSIDVKSKLPVTARRVGSVPMPHFNTGTTRDELDGVGLIPGFVPDVLYPEAKARVANGEVNAFWITVEVPAGIKPGTYPVDITLTLGSGDGGNAKKAATLKATVQASKVVLQPRRDFRITHWFYADALCDWYKLEPWNEPFWAVCEKYMRNYAQHGLDTIYAPVFTPPLDGVKRPTQLLKVTKKNGKYQFDWTQVKRWVALAKKCGITHFEWTHFFTQWGVKHAIRIYENHGFDARGGEPKLLWPADTGATSKTYRAFLDAFMPQFHAFLQREKLLDKSFFHVSDEPHGDEHLANYRLARSVLRDVAPWMKVMDALSDIRYGREGLTDIPIPSIQTTKQFVDEKIPSWTYYCCGPRGKYLNRLLDTPLGKIRMNGWLFYRFGVGGFLHWGYNYWYKSQTRQLIDPFQTTDGQAWPGWAYGDTSVVYPGPIDVGPIDSIRWEIFAQSLQDFRLLQSLGVDRGGKLLASLKDFNDFPRNEKWVNDTRKKLLLGKR